MTFEELRAEVFRRLRESTTSPVVWSQADIDQSLNEALDEMADACEFHEKHQTIELLPDHRYYDMRRITRDRFLVAGPAFNNTTNRWLSPTTPNELESRDLRWEERIAEPERFMVRGLWWLGYWPVKGGAFPLASVETLPLIDDFNRTDGVLTSPWVTMTSWWTDALAIESNQVKGNAVPNNGSAWLGGKFGPDFETSVVMTVAPTNATPPSEGFGFTISQVAPQATYTENVMDLYVSLNADGSYFFEADTYDAPGFVYARNGVNASVQLSAGDVVRLRKVYSIWSFFVNDDPVLTVEYDGISGPVDIGVSIFHGSDVRLDDFRARTIDVSADLGSIKQYYIGLPDAMDSDNAVPPFDNSYHYGLVEYALWDLFAQDGEVDLAWSAWTEYLKYEAGLKQAINDRVAIPIRHGLRPSEHGY